MIHKIAAVIFVFLLTLSSLAAQPRTGSLSGQVADELGALVVGATVTLTGAAGGEKTAITNNEGSYAFTSLTPGRYTIKVASSGFSNYENGELEIKAAHNTQNVRLVIATARQLVTVTDGRSLNTDSENNADAVVLKGADLDVLPDDPDALAAAAQAMAGPSAGPNGAQIFIDGFTGGQMPPKDSIREVRVNQNPFNAENSGIGFGRIDILTKPGMDKLRVSTFYNFGDESLNSRNPFALRRQPFQIRYFGGSISGPIIAKKSSFFFDSQRRVVDDNSIINATVLTPGLEPLPFRLTVPVPVEVISLSPRFDYQLGTNHTLVMRYTYSRFKAKNQGVSDFSLPSRAFNRANTEQTFQVTETAVLSPKMLNETRFQYIRSRSRQEGGSDPTVVVQESFIQGGSQIGQAHNEQDNWELQNYSTRTSGNHVLRFGGRLRHVHINDVAPTNFGGTFTFSGGFAPQLNASDQIVLDSTGNPILIPITSLERYRRTLLFQGRADLRALGGGATQFSIAGGNPEAGVTQTEVGFFVQDEWRVRPNLTFTAGLRYEYQTNISSKMNFAPRLFFAWAPGGTSVGSGAPGGSSQPKFVIRGGMGVFYDRLGERATLLANRFDGETQHDFRVANPTVLDLSTFALDGTVTNVPSAAILGAFSAPQIVRQIAPDFRAPMFVMTAINIERQLPYKFVAYLVGFNYRGKHLLRLRNINAPLPGTYNPANPAAAIRPNGNIGDIYYYESAARFNDYRMFGGLRRQMSKGFSLFVNFGTGRGHTDTDCIFASIGNCFPANSYDATSEYSRVGFIPSFNLFTGGTIILPKLKLTLNPFIVVSSGRPFNIVTGRDTNGDGLFTERPAFATARTDPADLKHTKFGDFDLNPAPGQPLIPRNYGMGPSFFAVNLGISRALSFGEMPLGANVAPAPPPGNKPANGEAAKTDGNKAAATSQAKPGGAPKPEKRYTLTFSVNIQNLLNSTNLNQPIGNLSSPQFGLSTGTLGGFGFGPSGSAAAGNRRIQGQIRFSF